jgi:hypothetical protein
MDRIVTSMTVVHGETRIIAGNRRSPWRRLGNKIELVQFYYSRLAHFCIFVFMKRIILSALCISTFAFANVTNFELQNDGIPWNREFDSDRMVRHQTFDPALKVAYSYSLNFVAGSFGSFANQSFMGHFAYEFTPNLHLYANVGLWMPIYANISNGSRIAKEDLRQGNVNVLIPDVSLEYKPSENTLIRISYVNERDALKAYGPRSFFHNECPSRSSILCQ